MDYDTLIAGKATPGSIASWVNSDSVPGVDIVADTEEWLCRNMRVRRMQRRVRLILPEGAASISLSFSEPLDPALPTDDTTVVPVESLNFLDPIRLHMEGFGDLLFIPEDDIDRVRGVGTDGKLSESAPSYWTVLNDEILFDTQADEDYTFILSYYARPPALTTTNKTNLFTTDWRNPFKWAAMGFAYIFLKDEQRAAGMFALATGEIQKGVVLDDRTRRGMSFNVSVS